MKKLTVLLPVLVVALALFLCTAPAPASTTTSGSYTYTVIDEAAKTAKLNYVFASGVVNIPSVIDGYKIISLMNTRICSIFAKSDYAANNNVTSVYIPDSVISIGWYAFKSCSNLTSIYFYGNAPTFVGKDAFNGTGYYFGQCNLRIYYISGKLGWTSPTWKSPGMDYKVYNTSTFVSPVSPVLQSIVITTQANKLTYTVGDMLDLTGLVVTGYYSDGNTAVLPVTASNVTGFNSSAPVANQTLTVTVEGKIVTYDISILKLGDMNGDESINILDLLFMAANIGHPTSSPDAYKSDVNKDGQVNILDLLMVAENIGN